MSEERLISQVAFEDGGLAIQYVDSDDIRVEGRVVLAKQISISNRHPDYAEDMESLYRKVQRLLGNVLEDFEDSEPYVGDDEDDDDEIKGMGDR